MFVMSHFLTYVLVPKGVEDVEAAAQNLLAPFDENFPCSYDTTECGCCGTKDRKTCKECKGTNVRVYSYNPDAKWDWWEIGGRWDGLLRHNAMNAAKLVASKKFDELVPFAVLTPDGEWHEQGRMGWFGHAQNEKESAAWKKEVTEVLKHHADSVAVACDLHI